MILVFGCVLSMQTSARAATTAWITTSTDKVFPDVQAPADAAAPYELLSVRNEFAPFQVAVRADADVQGVSVAVSDFTGPAGVVIQGSKAQLLLVETVTIKDPFMGSERKVWPDPLPPYHAFDVKANETRAVWVDLFAPADAAPGAYSGTVSVKAGGAETQLPVTLTVRDIEISTNPHLNTAFGISWGDIAKAHGVEPDSPAHLELKKKYYWLMVEHRLSPYSIPVDLYSEEAHEYLDDPRVTFFRAPMSWDEAEMQRIADRLAETGWIDKSYMYHVDEPDSSDYEKINKIGQWVHKFNPDIKMLLTYRYDPALEPANIQVWCPGITYVMAPNEMKGLLDQKKRGKDLWWYTCIGPKWPGTTYFIDDAATAPRMHPWMNNLYGVSGILYWRVTAWSRAEYNPWINTETYPGGNGDGSLLYPGSNVGYHGPVVSQRVKMLREGLEDYELLHVLRTRLAQAAQAIGGLAAQEYDPGSRLFDHAFALINDQGRSNALGIRTPYQAFISMDYHVLETQRAAVMDEIETADQSPLILAMTDPYDKGYTTRDQARVWGYAEQGAAVTVNGQPAQIKGVAFRAKVPLKKGANELRIVVAKGGAEKTVVRTIFKQ
jgi:hypothetical protein